MRAAPHPVCTATWPALPCCCLLKPCLIIASAVAHERCTAAPPLLPCSPSRHRLPRSAPQCRLSLTVAQLTPLRALPQAAAPAPALP